MRQRPSSAGGMKFPDSNDRVTKTRCKSAQAINRARQQIPTQEKKGLTLVLRCLFFSDLQFILIRVPSKSFVLKLLAEIEEFAGHQTTSDHKFDEGILLWLTMSRSQMIFPNQKQHCVHLSQK